jgi:hypothetical protein
MTFELLEGSAFESPDHVRIGRVWKHYIPSLVEHLGLLQAPDLDLAADVLGALPPLELDHLDAELVDCVLLDTEPGVLHVRLHDDRSVAVVLGFLVEVDPALQVDGVGNPAVLEDGAGVHAGHVLTDRQARPRQGAPDRETFPVVLRDIGGADARDDPRVLELQAAIVTEGDLQVHVREDRQVAVRFDANRADRGPHDVEVGVVDGISLLGRGRDHAERLGVDHLVTPVGGLSDFAHADAAVHARDAHPRLGRHRVLRPVLRQGRGRCIDPRRHG